MLIGHRVREGGRRRKHKECKKKKRKPCLREIMDSISSPSLRLGSNGNFIASVSRTETGISSKAITGAFAPYMHKTPSMARAKFPIPPPSLLSLPSGSGMCFQERAADAHARTRLPFCSDRPFPLSCGNLTCSPRTITRRTWERPSLLQHKKTLSAFREQTSSIFSSSALGAFLS